MSLTVKGTPRRPHCFWRKARATEYTTDIKQHENNRSLHWWSLQSELHYIEDMEGRAADQEDMMGLRLQSKQLTGMLKFAERISAAWVPWRALGILNATLISAAKAGKCCIYKIVAYWKEHICCFKAAFKQGQQNTARCCRDPYLQSAAKFVRCRIGTSKSFRARLSTLKRKRAKIMHTKGEDHLLSTVRSQCCMLVKFRLPVF